MAWSPLLFLPLFAVTHRNLRVQIWRVEIFRAQSPVPVFDRLFSTHEHRWFRTTSNRSVDRSSFFPPSFLAATFSLGFSRRVVHHHYVMFPPIGRIARGNDSLSRPRGSETVHVHSGTPPTVPHLWLGLAPCCQRRVNHVTRDEMVLVAPGRYDTPNAPFRKTRRDT